MEQESEANLNKIKKVIATSSVGQANLLLNSGWVLLEIQKTDPGNPTFRNETVIYHLGHTDPKADVPEYTPEYTRPEELYK